MFNKIKKMFRKEVKEVTEEKIIPSTKEIEKENIRKEIEWIKQDLMYESDAMSVAYTNELTERLLKLEALL